MFCLGQASPSFLRDTSDFIQKLGEIPKPLPDNITLFCFDVQKLHPTFLKKEGLDACREALDGRMKDLVSSTDEVLEVISTGLENNNFGLGDTYKQIQGVSIGPRLGKNFACSYMRKWNEQLVAANKTPVFDKRFIDDGFRGWIRVKRIVNHLGGIKTQSTKISRQTFGITPRALSSLIRW